jgi:hypothetical protein
VCIRVHPWLLFLAATSYTAAARQGQFLAYEQAQPALQACGLTVPATRSSWPSWLENHDREIRSRLIRGEEDSLVNFVLFGVSFTRQPRVSPEAPDHDLISARVEDFLRAVAAPGKNERLVWLRDLVTRQGHREPESLKQYVFENISRYLAERRQYRRILNSGPANDPVASQLYSNRGLAPDTNFRPNYAIEQALAELRKRGALASVRRAAVIGPGLDFTDKDGGFDYYPLQTLQPFALIDSLLRLGLAKLASLRAAVFDINPQILDHLAHPRQPYTIQLVLDPMRPWTRGVLEYWRRFGDRVGRSIPPLAAPSQLAGVERRAVRIRPEVTAALDPQDLNIVLQRPETQYDLIVATNVFVYYDALDQTLAALNIESMLRPGGIFLSNSLLDECPGVTLHSTGYVDVRYSQENGDDDRIEIYSNSPLKRGLGPE